MVLRIAESVTKNRLGAVFLLWLWFLVAGEVGKGLVGLGHAVSVFAFFDGVALTIGGREELVGQQSIKALAGFVAGRVQNPGHGQMNFAITTDFHGDLIGGAADTLGAHHNGR